jgi:hypothetical protein
MSEINSAGYPVTQAPFLVGGALSREFPQCSVIASDLAEAVTVRLQQEAHGIAAANMKTENNVVTPHVLGELGEPKEVVVSAAGDQTQRDFEVDCVPTRLVFFQYADTRPEEVGLVSGIKDGISRRVPTRSKQEPDKSIKLLGDPLMAVEIGDDTLLPLGTFAVREGSECSYVQLGQEMHDENVFLNPLDENTTRLQIIMSLMGWLTPGGKAEDKQLAHDIIQAFINQQAEIHHEKIVQAYEEQVIRKSFEVVEASKETRQIQIVNDKEQPVIESVTTSTVIPSCIFEGGKAISLVLARPAQTDQWLGNRLSLLAITREGIAENVGTLKSGSKKIEFSNKEPLSPEDRKDIVRYLLLSLTARNDANAGGDTPNYLPELALGQLDRQIASYCFQRGMISGGTVRRGVNDKVVEHPVEPMLKSLLDAFFEYPDEQFIPFPQSKMLLAALALLQEKQVGDREILGKLHAGEVLQAQLGETRPCDEALMMYIAKMALHGQSLEPVLVEAKMQNGYTTRALVSAQIAVRDGIHEVRVVGRPSSQPKAQPEYMIGFPLDSSKPYLGQGDRIETIFREELVKEYVALMSGIFAQQVKAVNPTPSQ